MASVTSVLFTLFLAANCLRLDTSTVFYEVRTDASNDSGDLSYFYIDMMSPSTPPTFVANFSAVPGGRASFGIEPVRQYFYFSMYEHFDATHEGTSFGRFRLGSPSNIEHLMERTGNEPGGLRVAPGSRVGETFFVTCMDDIVTQKHTSIVLHVFDNGDLDTRTVATFAPDKIDDPACRIPVACSLDDPDQIFIGGTK
jgi:hypothetical protein